MPNSPRVEGDRPPADRDAHDVQDDLADQPEPDKRDPASFPTQTWEGDDNQHPFPRQEPGDADGTTDKTLSMSGQLWAEDDAEQSYPPQEWEGEEERQPSAEQILDALQCVFHQTGTSFDGAASSLNAVLQGPYFDDDSLEQLTGGGPMDAYAVNMALRSFNLSLHPATSHRALTEPHLENAFLCFQHKRWFALRRIGSHWLNLSEHIQRPAQIHPRHLSASLSHIQEDGCEVYVVRGKLPMCAADETNFFDEHFLWFLNGGIVADDAEGECCEGVCAGECQCDELDEAYEDDLQAAIEASLKEAAPGKPLAIKSSPPTSLISSEEQVGGALSLKGVTSKGRDAEES